ncbi:MAG: molybdopterin-dependent oxidoreductase [Actinomycetota bacterium]|nr:molybdopterin-dependent oxidoreductase [Actinomycetota bacterium]
MSSRRTNLGLLAFLALALATGALSFGIGTDRVRLAAIAHGVAGLGVIVLSPWKSVVIRRGLRRRPPGWRPQGLATVGSLALTLLLVIALATGLSHMAGVERFGSLTAMQIHVGAALGTLPFALWHVLVRPAPLRASDLSRRGLLRMGFVLAAAGVVWGTLEGLVVAASLPGARRRATGSHEAGSYDPPRMPVTQWLDDAVPRLDAAAWMLTVRLPQGERRWRLHELESGLEPLVATLDCTGGWYATQEWWGLPLRRLVGSPGDARSILVRSVTGYTRRLPVADLDRLWLATRIAGVQLSPGHGFPARIVAPGRRGFWWVKWVDTIELSEVPWWWQSPFPLT